MDYFNNALILPFWALNVVAVLEGNINPILKLCNLGKQLTSFGTELIEHDPQTNRSM